MEKALIFSSKYTTIQDLNSGLQLKYAMISEQATCNQDIDNGLVEEMVVKLNLYNENPKIGNEWVEYFKQESGLISISNLILLQAAPIQKY